MSKYKWQECPRCESKKINEMTKLKGAMIGLCMFSCSIWLLIIPPIGIIGMLTGLAFIPVSFIIYPRYICRDCKFSWKPEKNI